MDQEDKPMPIEPQISPILNIPVWHPMLNTLPKRDPLLRERGRRQPIKSSPGELPLNSLHSLLNSDMDPLAESSAEDCTENSSETSRDSSTDKGNLSLDDWLDARRKKSISLPSQTKAYHLENFSSAKEGSPKKSKKNYSFFLYFQFI